MKKRILFLCTGNSARSQMAEGLLRHFGGDKFEVLSAGTNPAQISPFAIKAMVEIGIDISGQKSKSVEKFEGQEFDYVITLCDNARQTCPVFRGGHKIHWGLKDPAANTGKDEEKLKVFRKIRDEIKGNILDFLI